MTESLCDFSLIFPGWLATVFTALGAVFAIIGIVFLAKGTRVAGQDEIKIKLSFFEFSTNIVGAMLVLGIVLLLPGAVALAAINHEPFARWIGSTFTFFVDKKDPAVAGEFNNETLGSIAENVGQGGRYVVQMSDAARQEKINGPYDNNRCYAELVTRICRQESQRLTCNIDASKKTVRVCRVGSDADCPAK
jgi:hypothetical protein